MDVEVQNAQLGTVDAAADRAAAGERQQLGTETDAQQRHRRSNGLSHSLPQNLGEAIALMERSELVAETLGEHVFDFFLRNKKQEWEEYRSEVTAFELRKNLPVL